MNNNAYRLTKEIAKDLIPEAMELASKVETDELDCSKSFVRKPTNKTPDEVFQMGLEAELTHWIFIYRNMDFIGEDSYYDVGCSTIGGCPEYFLWINLSVENGEKLIKKYNLKKRY